MNTTEEALADLRRYWDHRESRANGDTFAGIEYDTDLVSSQGCAVTLFPKESATREEIAKAKIEARNKRDVVCFYVNRVPDDWYPSEVFQPGPAGAWIDAARWVRQHKQARRVYPETGELVPENKTGGILLDSFSAGRMVSIYDALNEKNKAKFGAMDVRVAHHIAFSLK